MLKTTKNKLLFAMALIVIFATIIIIYLNPFSSRLTNTQIKELRSQYPIYTNTSPMVNKRQMTLDECKNIVDTFVYAKVVGDIHEYDVEIDFGNDALEEKRESAGFGSNYSFYDYTLSVIDDSENILSSGENITITEISFLKDNYPNLVDGMEIVLPITPKTNDPTRYRYTADGMFYVTSDGYVLSVFNELQPSNQMSGMQLRELMQELKK